MEVNNNRYSAKCPGCGKIFVFTILYPEIVFKQDYKCRHCTTVAKIGDFVNEANPTPQTPPPPKPETQRPAPPPILPDPDDPPTIPSRTLGVLVDNEGNEYKLQEGRNTIGRKADSSTASIQIPTKDKSMSRNHIAITAVQKPYGGYKYMISNTNNKFGTYINGSELEKGQYISLLNGDKIMLSRTELTFKC